MKYLIPFLSGLVFGVGLLVSGMNDPHKVRAFLDILGDWQPELMAVMAAAVVTFFIACRLSQTRAQPLFAERFSLPALKNVDRRLLSGAVLFGVGWGLVGLCPGPALVDLLSGNDSVLIFIAALVVGNRAAHYLMGPAR